jgi:hypothetical protein
MESKVHYMDKIRSLRSTRRYFCFQSSRHHLILLFVLNIINFSKIYNAHLVFLHSADKKVHLVDVSIRLMLSGSLCPKVITLSDTYCINNNSFLQMSVIASSSVFSVDRNVIESAFYSQLR